MCHIGAGVKNSVDRDPIRNARVPHNALGRYLARLFDDLVQVIAGFASGPENGGWLDVFFTGRNLGLDSRSVGQLAISKYSVWLDCAKWRIVSVEMRFSRLEKCSFDW